MWVQIDNEYLNYLRDYGDQRVPYQNYGKHKFKPFFKVFKLKDTNIVYVANIGHNNKKHNHFIESVDYKIIYDDGIKVGGIHLNTMFPVPEDKIIPYTYEMVEAKLSWGDSFDFSRHLPRYKLYEEVIKDPIVLSNATQIYRDKMTNSKAINMKRTLDFSTLEAKMLEYQINEFILKDDTSIDKVEVSREGPLFVVENNGGIKRVNYNQITDVAEIVRDMELEAGIFEIEL